MKKLLFIALFGGIISLSAVAQKSNGKSAHSHSHVKVKKVKKTYPLTHNRSTHRKAINTTHKTEIQTIKDNDALTNQQQKTMVKQSNANHKVAMKNETMLHKKAKK